MHGRGFSVETGSCASLFHNDGSCNNWISEFGTRAYRKQLRIFLKNNDKTLGFPIDYKIFGCLKCKRIYNYAVLEYKEKSIPFIFNFKCKCHRKLEELQADIVDVDNDRFLKLYNRSHNEYPLICPDCNQIIEGKITWEMYID